MVLPTYSPNHQLFQPANFLGYKCFPYTLEESMNLSDILLDSFKLPPPKHSLARSFTNPLLVLYEPPHFVCFELSSSTFSRCFFSYPCCWQKQWMVDLCPLSPQLWSWRPLSFLTSAQVICFMYLASPHFSALSLLSFSKFFPTLPRLLWEVRTRTTWGNQQAGKPWICTVVLWYFGFWSVILFLRTLTICFAFILDHSWSLSWHFHGTIYHSTKISLLSINGQPTILCEILGWFPSQMCNIFDLSTLNFICHFTAQPHKVHL